MDIPPPQVYLTDTELRARNKRLLAARKKMRSVKLEVCVSGEACGKERGRDQISMVDVQTKELGCIMLEYHVVCVNLVGVKLEPKSWDLSSWRCMLQRAWN